MGKSIVKPGYNGNKGRGTRRFVYRSICVVLVNDVFTLVKCNEDIRYFYNCIVLFYISIHYGLYFGYFVLLPALKQKPENEGSLVFDNFLYSENALKDLNRDAKNPAVLSLRRFIQFSEYSFIINFIFLLLFFNIS